MKKEKLEDLIRTIENLEIKIENILKLLTNKNR